MPDSSERILDLVLELWNSGDPEIATQLYSDQSERADPNKPQPTRGAQQIAKYVAEVRTGFPDFQLQIKQRLSQGEHIASQWVCTGTHRGEFQGIPPTDRRIEISGMALARIKNGRVIEEHVYFDRLAMLEQLGVAFGPAQSEAKRAAQ